ncbi:bifunctional UDP-N-acetylglucosamine diphosphorylase/glucosamine-1-phosphate N-acetyltransferase GlmU [Zongyangia hominis]|uniref:Bifunctional protein GlmU n=1 Tax=Zongyangia hominis TaxID=2763677 RepID=A0A926EAY6_9FIRM|nr:bifunctional UDP-N-acetylglucosamine diphosphorylase/glucosamine-1-phosphate N-acetyltransferase GlmU [Zongyangia hominis]MBC8570562.1 bifunctional UDP-N-acetylglucosamine diphosphorylase/glucosamine-1-phosphate N-acetyltransferase GlmU [Zongyangia hominis]
MNDVCALILAAGDGKRMKSKYPKVLCRVLERPMIQWVLESVRQAGMEHICVITGRGGDLVRESCEGCSFAEQAERLGTGHAAAQGIGFLREHPGDVLVLCGDAPFIDAGTIERAHVLHTKTASAVTVITASLDDPTGYGRIVRRGEEIAAIVEQSDATETERAIKEVNSGAYWFDGAFLIEALGRLTPQNAQGEYYLTDTVKIAVEEGRRVSGYLSQNPDVILGANSRQGLYALTEIARRKVIEDHMENGVEFVSLDGVLIAPGVKIGPDTRILPGTILLGDTVIGEDCVIGPQSRIENSVIGSGSTINACQIYDSKVGEGVKMGPFVHIRPNSVILDKVKIGDFVEIKNSQIGEGTKVPHLTYVGDSDVGKGVNFGCGCVTVNYDGRVKSRTTVGDHAFIGCNTNLIAPVKVGDGAYTAAGSTITEDVPDGAMAIARSRQENKAGYAEKKLKK